MSTTAKATRAKTITRAKRSAPKTSAMKKQPKAKAPAAPELREIHREYHKWHSPRLEREMELLVFGHSGTKVLMFPTAGGTFYQYEDLRIIDRLRDKIADGHLQVYCLDSIDGESFYCWWAEPRGRIERHMKYEQYVLEEVFPLMEYKNPGTPIISFGCSLGAYHATNIALRHPHLFCKLCSFSGRFDLTTHMNGFRDLFDGYYDQDIYYHTPAHFIPNLRDHDILEAMRRMDIQIVIGRDDAFYQHNVDFSTSLRRKGIPHKLHTWNEEAHRGYYWRRMTSAYV